MGRMGLQARKQFFWQACKWARPGAGGGAGSKSDGFRKRINRVREVCRLDRGWALQEENFQWQRH